MHELHTRLAFIGILKWLCHEMNNFFQGLNNQISTFLFCWCDELCFFFNRVIKISPSRSPNFQYFICNSEFQDLRHLPRFFQTKKCYLPPAAPHEGRRGEEGGEEASSAAPRGPAGGCGTRTRPAPRTCTHRGEKCRGETEGVYLPSQLERTPQHGLWWLRRVHLLLCQARFLGIETKILFLLWYLQRYLIMYLKLRTYLK